MYRHRLPHMPHLWYAMASRRFGDCLSCNHRESILLQRTRKPDGNLSAVARRSQHVLLHQGRSVVPGEMVFACGSFFRHSHSVQANGHVASACTRSVCVSALDRVSPIVSEASLRFGTYKWRWCIDCLGTCGDLLFSA